MMDRNERPWRDEEKFREYYVREGMTLKEMADEFGCSYYTVITWRQKHEIESQPQSVTRRGNRGPDAFEERDTPWRDADILRELYWDELLTPREIAKELGCRDTTVVAWMDKLDVEINSIKQRRLRMEQEKEP